MENILFLRKHGIIRRRGEGSRRPAYQRLRGAASNCNAQATRAHIRSRELWGGLVCPPPRATLCPPLAGPSQRHGSFAATLTGAPRKRLAARQAGSVIGSLGHEICYGDGTGELWGGRVCLPPTRTPCSSLPLQAGTRTLQHKPRPFALRRRACLESCPGTMILSSEEPIRTQVGVSALRAT